MNVLLSIKPEFSEKILSGVKQYEFRKTIFSDPSSVETAYMYASSPVQEVVGAFHVGNVNEGNPKTLWGEFGEISGINDETRFLDYFGDNDTGYAIEIQDPISIDPPVNPRTFVNDFRPPVSFQYVNGEYDHLLDRKPQKSSD